MKDRDGMTLIEFLIVITITLISISIVGGFIINALKNTEKIKKALERLDDYINSVDYYFTQIYKYSRSLGRHPDVITVSSTYVKGKVYVLDNEHDAWIMVKKVDNKKSLIWKVDDEEKVIIPPSEGFDLTFEKPPSSVVSLLSDGVYITIKKFVELDGKTHKLIRKVFIPFINVK